GNPQQALRDKGLIDSGCSRHMTGNMSYLSDFKELTGGYVAFGVLLRVPRENNMYNVHLRNIIPSGDLTCLFAKATLDESNLWHRRLGHVNFKTINKLVKGNLVRGLPTKENFKERLMKDFLLDTLCANNNKDALVDGKEHDGDIQKSVSPDIHSLSSGAQTRKQGEKTENKDKGKSHVVTITGFRDLNAEFKECTNNSSNGVNAASYSVSTAK
nr:ribonuclease H-like domain-containing protein [Tanacetum cinerariifolium]